jgi:hypothetical protein
MLRAKEQPVLFGKWRSGPTAILEPLAKSADFEGFAYNSGWGEVEVLLRWTLVAHQKCASQARA